MLARFLSLFRLVIGAVLLSNLLWSQNAADARSQNSDNAGPLEPRPRVGLVLEGGGALGLAHVGVIKWLEENRIPVDVIAGTRISCRSDARQHVDTASSFSM